jgi:hypothetical protein
MAAAAPSALACDNKSGDTYPFQSLRRGAWGEGVAWDMGGQ